MFVLFPISLWYYLSLSGFLPFSSALLVLLQDSLIATTGSPMFSELVMKVGIFTTMCKIHTSNYSLQGFYLFGDDEGFYISISKYLENLLLHKSMQFHRQWCRFMCHSFKRPLYAQWYIVQLQEKCLWILLNHLNFCSNYSCNVVWCA